jgi:hypothetical protein
MKPAGHAAQNAYLLKTGGQPTSHHSTSLKKSYQSTSANLDAHGSCLLLLVISDQLADDTAWFQCLCHFNSTREIQQPSGIRCCCCRRRRRLSHCDRGPSGPPWGPRLTWSKASCTTSVLQWRQKSVLFFSSLSEWLGPSEVPNLLNRAGPTGGKQTFQGRPPTCSCFATTPLVRCHHDRHAVRLVNAVGRNFL